jgi:AraC-like DNA-binding protein
VWWAAGIAVAKRKGVYKRQRKGTTKAEPTREWQLWERRLTVAEIAQVVGISERTVCRHLGGALGW